MASSTGSKRRSRTTDRVRTRWLEIAVPAHAEAVEAVSEILDRVGYNGIKRYIRLTITPSGNNSGAAPLAAIWVGTPRKRGNTLGS